MATLHVWFRDTQHVLRVGLQLLFYLTPVFYESQPRPGTLQWLYRSTRWRTWSRPIGRRSCAGSGPGAASLRFSVLFAAALLLDGIVWFRRASQRFADEL